MFIDLIIYSSVYLIFYLSILFDFCEYLTGHTKKPTVLYKLYLQLDYQLYIFAV